MKSHCRTCGARAGSSTSVSRRRRGRGGRGGRCTVIGSTASINDKLRHVGKVVDIDWK